MPFSRKWAPPEYSHTGGSNVESQPPRPPPLAERQQPAFGATKTGYLDEKLPAGRYHLCPLLTTSIIDQGSDT
ncbi:hypothetical protein [Marinobacter xestospongiae]|uniref:Uncharacterized protein n=1 Tax=Marinobacter xestospongiae TaxID=994319 RepID=A0ABU3W2Q9_9GAMM|nr:hypothetical protein [Marinobacter xestospongiae]MDV2080447.1 hypothetical protein [Marinobacter xestospongiae]